MLHRAQIIISGCCCDSHRTLKSPGWCFRSTPLYQQATGPLMCVPQTLLATRSRRHMRLLIGPLLWRQAIPSCSLTAAPLPGQLLFAVAACKEGRNCQKTTVECTQLSGSSGINGFHLALIAKDCGAMRERFVKASLLSRCWS